MKYFFSIIALILLSNFSAFAGISISTVNTNASNVTNPFVHDAGPNFYYSNVSGNSDGINWVPGNGSAGSCTEQSFLINPNCRDSTQLFNFSAISSTPTSPEAKMYIIYVPSGSPYARYGSPISALGVVVSSFPYQANAYAGPGNLHFGDICSAESVAGLAINAACVTTEPAIPFIEQFYVVADANGNGVFDSAEDILSFTFTVQSQIPVNSSIVSEIGVYGFQVVSGSQQVCLLPDQYQPGTGVSGATGVKFYYTEGPDVYSSFNVGAFQKINADLNPPSSTVSSTVIPLTDDGTLSEIIIKGLKNGTSYYFRSAIVDAAGNVGYLTPAADDDPGATAPFHKHATKPGSGNHLFCY